MDSLMQSRRTFIKSATATLGAAAAFGLTGGVAAAQEVNDTATSVDEISWDEEYDVVVVGGGLAGMASAVCVAKEGDGATCLLLEKGDAETGGGNSIFAAGMVLCTKDVENFYLYLQELRGEMDNTPDDVLHAYAEGIAENLDWLASLPLYNENEVTISDFYEVGSGSSCYPEYNELEHAYSISRIRWNSENENGLTQVTSFMNAVKNTYSDLITHKTGTPVTALVQDPSTKEILGCVYTENDSSVYVKANKGVIMCCGGFEANAQMKADYLSAPWARRIAGRCNEGDGITMCARCGADMWHMNSCAGFWTSMSAIDSDTCLMRTPKDQGITVGVNGRRFYMDWDTDVSLDWDTFTERDLRMHVGSRHGHMQFGGEWPHLPMPAVTWLIVGATGYQSILENKMMNITWDPMDGWGYSSDTLEGLAETIGVPADELVRSVEQWDECCANGEDVYFHRPASTLNPIGDGPYYALYCPPTILNTDGGPRRSAKGEILDLDGQPIPHLYSAGEFGSIWANMYQGAGNLGECLAFGRISARNCLGIA